jgi:SNF2 family DNA or RNA helicase
MLRMTLNDDEIVIIGSGIPLVLFKSKLANLISLDEVTTVKEGGLRIPSKYLHQISDLLQKSTAKTDTESSNHLKKAISGIDEHLNAKKLIQDIVESGETSIEDPLWKPILTPYQALAVNCITLQGLKGLCLFDEQGTGKTVTAIAAFDILVKRNVVDRMIVVSPTTLIGNWALEIKKFAPNLYSTLEVKGSSKEKFELLNCSSQIYLMNYETVSMQETMVCSIASTGNTLLVADESFMIKNPDAKRSVAIESLRKKCCLGLMLCGTPAPNSPTDIVHQFNIADGGITFSGYSITGNMEKDRHNIESCIEQRGAYLRRLKSDVLPELPDKNFQVVQIPLEGEQAALYREASHALQLELQKLDNEKFLRSLAWYFQRRSALLQLCVNPRLIDPLYSSEPAKHKALDKILDHQISLGKKIVIWSVYRSDIDDIETRYSAHGVVRIDGSIPSVERSKMVERFQNDPSIKVFVGNPAAAGAGITLHAASICIYVSFSNQAAHFMQSLDRIHRKGQLADSVEYIFLVAKNTLEERELAALQQKEKAQKDLLGDEADEGSFTLAYALEELSIQ